MDYYGELKFKNEILTVAFSLGYNGKKCGSSYQGDCARHGSSGGKCLVIWPRIQGFKCFHCGEKGDVIKLVMLFKNCDHRSARDFLADRVGMPHLNERNLSSEELEKREAEMKEKSLVEDMLTEANQWYHNQLGNYPNILSHLHNHYGFSQEIIDELLIGFAPPPREGKEFSQLADHLSSFLNFKGKLALSGLFMFASPSGPFYDYLKGRIVFPYWKGGKVVYMAGRATSLTPIDHYECYTKDGDIKKNEQGNPEFIKYKKLRTHDPNNEKKKFISTFIQNDVFLGEDGVYGQNEIIITEGFSDWVSALDKGFAAISPATTSFRENDLEKLAQLTKNADAVYIINDNEENLAGLNGAINTAKYLTGEGRNVFLVELPRPKDKDKIDLNEYLLDHTAEDLRTLMVSSRSFLEILIDELPRDFVKAQPIIKTEIAPILIKLDKGILEHFINLIRKRTKTNQKAILAEIEAAEEEKLKQSQQEEEKVDPEVEKEAQVLAMDPLLFKKRIDMVNKAGVVGERGVIAMYVCALDSRLLPEDPVSPNVLAMKNAGHFGSGKSYTLITCLQVYPKSAYYLMTNGSAKSIFFLRGGLKHKALIVTEGFQFQTNNAVDSELVYSIRSLLSEGRISYSVVEKDEDGHLITIEKKLEGPTSFLTTTTMESLEAQFEDRLFTIHPDESIDQTKAVLMRIAEQRDGTFKGLDQKTIDSWKLFHQSLKPVNVLIPFARDIIQFINKNATVPLATRRASKRVMTVIQTIACAYQHQRQKDEQGRVIAEISDYWMALQIVHEAFRENMGDQSKNTEERLEIIKEEGKISPKELAKKLGVSGSAISGWSNKKVREEVLTWCDEFDEVFLNDKDLKKAKHSGKAYLKISDSYTPVNAAGLPTPFDLTHDEKWNQGGELLLKYDLELKVKPEPDGVLTPCLGVLTPDLNTIQEDNLVNIIQNSDDEQEGVKVFSEIPGGEGNNFEEVQEREPEFEPATQNFNTFGLQKRLINFDDFIF